jgi:hypothetical protein
MMQFWTHLWRFRGCQNFMPFASALHAAVAFSMATLSALDVFAASAGLGANAMPLTSIGATIPAIKVVAKRYMTPSFNRNSLDEANINLCVFPALLQDRRKVQHGPLQDQINTRNESPTHRQRVKFCNDFDKAFRYAAALATLRNRGGLPMKLIFSFWFISPALAQPANSGGGDISTAPKGLIVLLVIVGIIFLVVRNRKRVAADKRAAEQTEIARQLSRERAGIFPTG